MDAFDADVLIYAATPSHPLGPRLAALISAAGSAAAHPPTAIGSLLLLPEVLGKPLRDGRSAEAARLAGLLTRIELRPLDVATAELAVALSATYALRAADSVHLATAVNAGADRFITNNRRDFHSSISEVEVTYPDDLDSAL